MKRILLSVLTLGTVGAVAFAATGAFFNDEEVSTGNTFQAGAVDLKVDSDCHKFEFQGLDNEDQPIYDDVGCSYLNEENQLVQFGNFGESDLTSEKFFMFNDIKPGDWGENTISLHVYDNDAWGRMFLANVVDADNTCTEPELDDEPTCNNDTNGELDNFMSALMWLDQGNIPGFQCSEVDGDGPCDLDQGEGDNVWQGLPAEPIVTDNISDDFELPLSGLLTLAHTQAGGTEEEKNAVGLYADGRMKGSITYYLGVAWCFGEGDLLDFGTPDFFCDGTNVDNTPQTDSLSGSVGFEVEQWRNNPNPFVL